MDANHGAAKPALLEQLDFKTAEGTRRFTPIDRYSKSIMQSKMAPWITLEEAKAFLGVRSQTIYAYVSRRLIEANPDPENPRCSLYRSEDVQNLTRKKEQGRKRETLATNTIFGAVPSIPTSISTFARGRLYYRARDAILLSDSATLEDTARLLWNAEIRSGFMVMRNGLSSSPPDRTRAFVTLATATATGHSTHARAPKALHDEAATLVGSLASAFGAADRADMLIHQRLALGWKKKADVAQIFRRAMVLLADHELTSSAFAARITASTGASLAACLLAGLTTLTGPLHGDASSRVRALFDEIQRSDAEQVVDRYLSSAIPIPGFGHHLYPDGDPRAVALMAAFDLPDEIARFIEKVIALTGLHPNIDAALAALVTRYRLPGDAAFALFAIARSVGLLAHSMEQIDVGKVIRPRGRYVGPVLQTPINSSIALNPG